MVTCGPCIWLRVVHRATITVFLLRHLTWPTRSVSEVTSTTPLNPTTDAPTAIPQQLRSSASLDGSASSSASPVFEPMKSDPSEREHAYLVTSSSAELRCATEIQQVNVNYKLPIQLKKEKIVSVHFFLNAWKARCSIFGLVLIIFQGLSVSSQFSSKTWSLSWKAKTVFGMIVTSQKHPNQWKVLLAWS